MEGGENAAWAFVYYEEAGNVQRLIPQAVAALSAMLSRNPNARQRLPPHTSRARCSSTESGLAIPISFTLCPYHNCTPQGLEAHDLHTSVRHKAKRVVAASGNG